MLVDLVFFSKIGEVTMQNPKNRFEPISGWLVRSVMVLALVCVLLPGLRVFVSRAQPQAPANPGDPGPCATSSRAVTIGSMQATVHYPVSATCGTWASAPYAAIAFAHGFSMFGLSDGVAENAGNGQHLASWGYVVVIPKLEDAAATRIMQLGSALDYLVLQTFTAGGFLEGQVDVNRLAVAGHSLGGSTALATAAHDGRVKAVVALDPVYHEGGFSGEGAAIWNPAEDGVYITVPTGILGAPPSSCNAQADYAEIYGFMAATHRAAFLINGASHCDFPDPASSFCSSFCGDSGTDAARTVLSQKYMTAWFIYYLLLKTDYYTYLYGNEAAKDLTAEYSISPQIDTAPHGFTSSFVGGVVNLQWTLYSHEEVADYNVYRRLGSDAAYPAMPLAHLSPVSSFYDSQVVNGQTYVYRINSYDPLGNEHQASEDVTVYISSVPVTVTPTVTSAAPLAKTPTRTVTPPATLAPFVPSQWIYLPVVLRVYTP
jgi:hypothetical protein